MFEKLEVCVYVFKCDSEVRILSLIESYTIPILDGHRLLDR